jgi:hypothetical protein
MAAMPINLGIKPNIVDTLQREGIELKSKGRSLWGCCPLHQDKSPSFKVDPERQNFHCFGCNAHGDVITFIQQYRKLPFKEALAYLGINRDEQYRPDPREKKKRFLVKDFKVDCAAYSDRLAWELRGLRRLVQNIRTEADLELRAWAYHEIPTLEYKLDVLCYGTDEVKYLLYKEAMTNGSIV